MLPGHQQPSQSLLLLAWIPGIPFHNYLKTGHSVKLCIYISQNCIVGVCGFWKDHMLKFLYCCSYTTQASNREQTLCRCDIFLTPYVQPAPHCSHHINQTICNVYTITVLISDVISQLFILSRSNKPSEQVKYNLLHAGEPPPCCGPVFTTCCSGLTPCVLPVDQACCWNTVWSWIRAEVC